jgi:hypothetical protein
MQADLRRDAILIPRTSWRIRMGCVRRSVNHLCYIVVTRGCRKWLVAAARIVLEGQRREAMERRTLSRPA